MVSPMPENPYEPPKVDCRPEQPAIRRDRSLSGPRLIGILIAYPIAMIGWALAMVVLRLLGLG